MVWTGICRNFVLVTKTKHSVKICFCKNPSYFFRLFVFDHEYVIGNMKKSFHFFRFLLTVCVLIFCFAAWNAEAMEKYLKGSPDDPSVIFAKERLFKGEIGPVRIRDLNCPGGRGYIGTVRIPFHLGVYMGEPTYKYGFYWDWYDKSNLMVDSEHSIRLSDLRKYPNLYERFMAMKPLNLDFTMDMLLYEKGSLIGTAEFSIKGSKWQIPITEAGKIDADLIPGSPSWSSFFSIKNSSYPDNKSLFTAADRIEFKNVKIVRVEWASADGIIHDYLNKEEEKERSEKRALEAEQARERAEAEKKLQEERRLAERKALEQEQARERAEAERKRAAQAEQQRARTAEQRALAERQARESERKLKDQQTAKWIEGMGKMLEEQRKERESWGNRIDVEAQRKRREADADRNRTLNETVNWAKEQHDQAVREIQEMSEEFLSRSQSRIDSAYDQMDDIASNRQQAAAYLSQLEAEWKRADEDMWRQFNEKEAEIARSEADLKKQFEEKEAEIARLEREKDPWNTKNNTEFSALEKRTKTTLDDLAKSSGESQKKTASQKGSLLKAAKSESKDAQGSEKSQKGSLLASAKKKSSEEQKGSLLKKTEKQQDTAQKQKGSLLKLKNSSNNSLMKDGLEGLSGDSATAVSNEDPLAHDARIEREKAERLEEYQLLLKENERGKAERLKEYQELLAKVQASRESVRSDLKRSIAQYDRDIAKLDEKIEREQERIEEERRDAEREIAREKELLEEKKAMALKAKRDAEEEERIRLRNEQRRKEIEERERIIWGNNTNLWMRR